MTIFFHQGWVLLKHFFAVETASSEKWLTSLFFAATMILCFTFAFGNVDRELIPAVFLAQSYLCGFLTLQLSMARASEIEAQDQVFTLLKTYPIQAEAWYFAKYIFQVASGYLTLVPSLLLGALFLSDQNVTLLSWGVLLIALLAVAGCAAMGVLLGLMTLGARQKQILFPILYFPLTIPVLIAAVEGSRTLITGGMGIMELFSSWLGLLVIIDIIYCCLGFLLFGTLVSGDL